MGTDPFHVLDAAGCRQGHPHGDSIHDFTNGCTLSKRTQVFVDTTPNEKLAKCFQISCSHPLNGRKKQQHDETNIGKNPFEENDCQNILQSL